MSVNGQNPVSYGYDNDGLLTQAGALALTRDAQNGLLTATALGNVTDVYAYNGYGEVTSYSASYPAGLSCQVLYARDGVGRITGKTEVINGTTTSWDYLYDIAGRLSQTNMNGALYAQYSYDANGNRLAKTTSSQTTSAAYDNQDRMLNYGNNSYTYTANGELLTKTNTANGEVTSYTYDVLGNLKKVVLPDSTLIEYLVDGRNRRVGKKVNGVLTQAWLYDGQLRPIAEMDGAGNLTARFVYATHVNIPDYVIKGTATYRLITDHLGSLRFVINASDGTIAQRVDYDDWGNVLINTNPDFTPFGFAGGLYDSQTKLVRFGARDYDAETGRWTSKDQLLFFGLDTDLYAYAANDPLNSSDPGGMKRKCENYEPLVKWLDQALKNLATQLNVDEDYLMALAATESGWNDASNGNPANPPSHAQELNNPFGFTQAGGKNLGYLSLDAATTDWAASQWGPKVGGATSIDDFLGRMKGYNIVNPGWSDLLRNCYDQLKWYRANCGQCKKG